MNLIDANVLITAHNTYYPTNRLPEFWSWLLHQAEAGHVKMPREVIEEVLSGSGDAEKDLLLDWLKMDGVVDALQLDEDVDQDALLKVVSAYGDDLTEIDIEKMGRDPFLIAYAFVQPEGRRVVSIEVRKPKRQKGNRKVPDVCDDLGVPVDHTFDLIRRLDFTTGWEAEVEKKQALERALIQAAIEV